MGLLKSELFTEPPRRVSDAPEQCAVRDAAHIKPGDKMVAIAKHGILQYIPVRPLNRTKGMVTGLDTTELRDEIDRT